MEKVTKLIEAGKVQLHHISWARGYVKVNSPVVSEYNGKFGKGYKVDVHSSNSTRFHRVMYFIEG